MTHRNRLLLSSLAALALAACAPDPNPDVVKEVEAMAGPNAAPAVSTEDDASVPSDGPYAYDVAVTFTEASAKKLMDMGERVTVAGYYWGVPTAEAKGRADEQGQIPLGEDMVEIGPLNGHVTMPGVGLNTARLKDVEGGKPQLLVNVYSARLKHNDNLLDCGIFEGPVTEAQGKTPEISCKLIVGEPG